MGKSNVMDFRIRIFLLPVLIILLTYAAQGQEFRMGQQAQVTTCGGFFTDSGGSQGNYSANETATITICSDGSEGSHVQLVFSNTEVARGDSLCFFDGTSTSATRLSCASDFSPGAPFIIQATAANTSGCLTIRFRSNGSDQRRGWNADINCVPACQVIQSVLDASSPAAEPADTGWIDICPGDRISFRGRGLYPQNGLIYQHSDQTAQFSWTFGDGNSAVGPEVSHVYQRSGGYIVQLTITDQFGCRSTNFINQRVRIATKPGFTLAGDLPPQICIGDTISVDAVINIIDSSRVLSVVPTEGSFQFGGFRSDSLPLPDGTGAAYETSIKFSDFQPGQQITNAEDLQSICVNMEHSWMRDLEISIKCPDGRSLLLHDYRGQVGGSVFLGEPNDYDDFSIRPGKGYDYCWTPTAANPNWLDYANTLAPRVLPAGDYRSVDPFSKLVGCPLNGEWTIRVLDRWGQDNGFIFSWGINFNPNLFPNLETYTPTLVDSRWQPAPSTLFQSADSLAAIPPNAGQACYIFSVVDDFGCQFDSTVCIKVLPQTHPDCYDCRENLGEIRDTALCNGQSANLNIGSNRNLIDTITFESLPRREFGFSNAPPAQPYRSVLNVNSVAPLQLTDPLNQIVSVCVDIESSWVGDLSLFLQAPSGIVLELTTGNGGDGDNYARTCFTPRATQAITAGTAPFTGNYRPEGIWSALSNTNVNGDWILLLSDAQGPGEFNRLNSWSITFRSVNAIRYTWTPSAGLSCADCPNPVARPQATTSYAIQATDLYGCNTTDTLTVGVVTDAIPPQVQCTVSENAEITFFWVPRNPSDRYETRLIRRGVAGPWTPVPANTNSLVFPNVQRREELSLQLRFFIGGNPANCDFRITESSCTYQPCNFDIELAAPPTPVSCFGRSDGSFSVRASGGDPPYQFVLNNGSPQDNGSFSGLPAGSYVVLVRDTGACEDSLRILINTPDSLGLSLTQVAQGCPGTKANQANATASGGSAPYSIRWNDGQTTNAAVNLDSLAYTATLTDSKGCTVSATLKLQDLPAFNPNIIQASPTCFGFTDGRLGVNFIEGGVSQDPNAYTYRWSTGASGPIVENLPGGRDYTVTVTDPNGCSVVVARELREPLPISFDVVPENVKCAGDRLGSAVVTNIRGDNNRFSIRWDAAAGNQTTTRATNLGAGIYRVTVTDEDNCSQSGQVRIEQPSQIILNARKTDNPCFGDEKGKIELSVQGGVPGYTIRWSTGGTGSQLESLRAGLYQVSVTDGNGCLLSDTLEITQPSLLSAQLTAKNPNCAGYRDGAITIAAQGGTMPYLYSLDNKDFSGSVTFVGLRAGNYQVYVRDQKNCLFIDRIRLDNPPAFSVDAGPDREIVLGDSIVLNANAENASGDVRFTWSAPYEGPLSCSDCPATLVRTINTVTLELSGVDSLGCEDNDFVTVNVDKPRVVEVPTGFSPNNDGNNDRLLVHGRRGTQVRSLRIYDRWGELVFELSNFEVNDSSAGWDGTFRGQPMNAGVYLWYVEVEYLDGATDVFKGQTTLIR